MGITSFEWLHLNMSHLSDGTSLDSILLKNGYAFTDCYDFCHEQNNKYVVQKKIFVEAAHENELQDCCA